MDMRLKILSAPERDPRSVVYGVTVGKSASSFLRGQLSWLREMGWRVSLVATPDSDAFLAASRENVELEPIQMRRELSILADSLALVRWIQVLRRVRPAAVNVGTPKAAFLGAIASFVTRVPKRLYVVRGLRIEGAQGILASILWLVERISIMLATDVLYVSRSLATAAAARHLLDTKKSWIIGEGSSNGVDYKEVAKHVELGRKLQLRQKLGFRSDHFVVGFIGRIHADKGIDTLIESFADAGLSARARLLVVGESDDPVLVERLESLGSRVVMLGRVLNAWDYFSVLDVLCLPTKREGFPNVILEAAAARVPTITTRATGAMDAVAYGKTGMLIDVGDSRSLTHCINALDHDRQRGKALADLAWRRAVDEFQSERIWRGVSEILEGSACPVHALSISE